MRSCAADLWGRALRSLRSAQALLDVSADDAASRAYYAAFHAVCALLAADGRTYRRHSAVEAAMHRDLVRTGRLSHEIGRAYSGLLELRRTGDYGGRLHVSAEHARDAIEAARRILATVSAACPDDFALPDAQA